MSDYVTCTIIDGVADVRLNRPERLNALDLTTLHDLVTVGESLKANRAVRAVVLSGEGRAFSVGLDFSEFEAMAGASRPNGSRHPGAAEGPERQPRPGLPAGLLPREGRITNRGQQAAFVWTEMPAPVIAAIHGHALGGGLQLALGADMRIVAPDALLSMLEIRWGLIPDMTGTQVLPGLVGLDVAKELTFTGRMVSGEEAVRLGLATRASPAPFEAAMELAGQIAAHSPHAVQGAKRLLNLAGQVPLEDGFIAEERTISALIGSPNQIEAVTAYFEKRQPHFED
jgi:enoyl-CoA hydratase/carnithine racemase